MLLKTSQATFVLKFLNDVIFDRIEERVTASAFVAGTFELLRDRFLILGRQDHALGRLHSARGHYRGRLQRASWKFRTPQKILNTFGGRLHMRRLPLFRA